MDRRSFLRHSGALALGSPFIASVMTNYSGTRKIKQVGIQLYTVRDAMATDTPGTLDRVAEIGFNYVEGAGYEDGKLYGMSPQAFSEMLRERSLNMPSNHVSIDVFEQAPEQMLEVCAALENEYVVLPYLEENRRSGADYRKLAELLNEVGAMAQPYNLRVAYHNHAFEFEPMSDGELPMDFLLRETDPDLVDFEMDHYWMKKAQKDSLAYFEQHPNRFKLWHVKDVDDSPEGYFASVGSGTIDWPSLFAQEQVSGLDYLFVEQDHVRSGNVFSAIEQSHQYLRDLRYKRN